MMKIYGADGAGTVWTLEIGRMTTIERYAGPWRRGREDIDESLQLDVGPLRVLTTSRWLKGLASLAWLGH